MDVQAIAILAPPLLLSLTCREVAHGWVAEKLGDPTARRMGRITLNPLKHLDLMGTLVFIMTQMVGWAKPVPVNPANFSRPRQMMAIVAMAGPLMNVFLALVSTALFHQALPIFKHIGVTAPESLAFAILQPLVLMIRTSVVINVALAIFNIIPINPLDGGRILSGVLSPDLAEKFNRLEGVGFIIVIILLATGILNATIFPVIRCILEWLIG